MRPQRLSGFAYIILLIGIVIIGIGAGTTLLAGARMSRRSAEQQLLVVGYEYERALVSYAGAGNIGPQNLSELLRDPRFPGLKRHLRQLYADPLTAHEWGIQRDPQGYIVGVFSLAQGKPIKRTGFDSAHRGFEDADNYAEWIFGLRPLAGRSSLRPGSAEPPPALTR